MSNILNGGIQLATVADQESVQLTMQRAHDEHDEYIEGFHLIFSKMILEFQRICEKMGSQNLKNFKVEMKLDDIRIEYASLMYAALVLHGTDFDLTNKVYHLEKVDDYDEKNDQVTGGDVYPYVFFLKSKASDEFPAPADVEMAKDVFAAMDIDVDQFLADVEHTLEFAKENGNEIDCNLPTPEQEVVENVPIFKAVQASSDEVDLKFQAQKTFKKGERKSLEITKEDVKAAEKIIKENSKKVDLVSESKGYSKGNSNTVVSSLIGPGIKGIIKVVAIGSFFVWLFN